MYTFDSTIRYSECTESLELSLVGLVDYLQDCSVFQTEHLGLGFDHMARNHFAWFVSAWQIQVERLPRLGEHVTVGTNCHSLGRTQSGRNFCMWDESGERIVMADSLWFTFDTEAKSPCKIPSSEEKYLTGEEPLPLPKTRRKLQVPEGGDPLAPIEVTRHHLDNNGHMNNAQYVAIAEDCVLERDPGFRLHRLLAQYRHMALLGDVMTPVVHPVDNGYVVTLENGDMGPFATIRMESRAGA